MKLLAINGSPRGKNSNTEKFMVPFVESAAELGVDVEFVYLSQKKINYCKGCYSCWTRTPGKCVINDSMEELLEQTIAADILVYGTPLYKYNMTGLMKNFFDRKQPLILPFVEEIEGRVRHPGRSFVPYSKKEVIISNCGFPEKDDFKGLAETFNEITIGHGHMIFLTCGEFLAKNTTAFLPYQEALKKAAKEIITEDRISLETQSILDKTPLDYDTFYNHANEEWRLRGGK
jgi:hypothetical protein